MRPEEGGGIQKKMYKTRNTKKKLNGMPEGDHLCKILSVE